MTARFCDSFAHYSVAQAARKYTTGDITLGNGSIDVANAFPGSYGAYAPATANNLKCHVALTAKATWLVCMRYKMPTNPLARILIRLMDPAGEQFSLRLDSTNHLVASRNGTTLATSTNTFSSGSIYDIQFKVTINNTAGVYECRINGSSVNWLPQATSQNTRGQTNNSASDIYIIGNEPGTAMVFSDVVICDGDGSVNNDFFAGTPIVVPLWARAAGNYQQWTAAGYADLVGNINERISDDDATFNQSSTAAQKDSYAIDDIVAGTVAFIQVVTTARQDAGAQRQLRPFLRIGGTDYALTTYNTPSSYGMNRQIQETSPATAVAFTQSEIGGMEVGYELIA